MSIIDVAVAERALDPAQLSGRDLIDAWRIARDYADPSIYAEVHHVVAVNATTDEERAANELWARIYTHAAGISRRARASFTHPMQGCSLAPTWPGCGVCGAEDATWRVFCCAEAGGELLACDGCSNYGDPVGSAAIEQVETSAIHRVSKVRVDALDVADVAVA